MMFKLVRWIVVVGICAVAASSLPDIARYLKMRSL
jgi:hypothetical protein